MAEPPSLADPYIPATRTKPMRVLCLGMCRTGTESLFAALGILGYTPYKGMQVMKDWERNIPLWSEALDARHRGVGRVWGKKEFDVMLANYDAVLDVPNILLVEDMVRAYPEAKVVLTTRDEGSWLRSMRETAGESLQWWTYPYVWQFHKKTRYRVGFVWKCMDCIARQDFSETGPARESFRRHNELVRKLVPPYNLLEFTSEQGWGPLCQFLGKDVPAEAYPRINDRAFLKGLQSLAYYYALGIAVLKVGAVLAVITIAIIYMTGS